VRETLGLVENEALVKGIGLRFEPAVDLPPVVLDRSQMQSVVLNMLLNAFDATERGGAVTIATAAAASTTDGTGGTRSGVEIVVSDTGCGIEPQNLARLFEPFFTTKEVGKGTGLGLSVSQGIVQRHGGTIHVRSILGRGSTFVVWLPVQEGGGP
jgi:two-component system NtrC family sensor kinase